ncbi:MAG: ATP-binding protein [Anaerolineae bacterium]
MKPISPVTASEKTRWFRRLTKWFHPRSTDPEIAFREGVIRSTLALISFLVVLSLALNIFLFRGELKLVSYYTMHIALLVACLVASWEVARGRVLIAGWLVVLTLLFGANCLIWLARQDQSPTGIINAIVAFFFIPLVAMLVLPRNLILPVSVMAALTYSLSQFVMPFGTFTVEGVSPGLQIPIVFIGLVGEGALLRQFRVEFDSRLDSLLESLRQLEIAKREAEDAEERATRERVRAEEADRAKSQFLANMSHELRTPLNAIIGYDEIMIGGMVGEFTPKQKDLLVRIQHNSRRLLTLINDVLDLSKIEAGAVEIQRVPISPRKLILDTVEDLRSLAHTKNLELTAELADSLPENVIGDPGRVQQVMVNLISNAISFTEVGEVRVTARGLSGSRWQFAVRDTGIGIPPESIPIIFEAFRQVDSTMTRKHKGTGLGLAICRRLIAMMGGNIEVESEVGKGSTFTVTLPKGTDTGSLGRTNALPPTASRTLEP